MNYTILIVNRIKCHGHTYTCIQEYLPSSMVHYPHISRRRDILFSTIKCAFGLNPRDAEQKSMKLATDGARMTIASGIRLYKHAYY